MLSCKAQNSSCVILLTYSICHLNFYLVSEAINKTKATLAIFLAVIMLQTSLGMLVYHHHCHATGKSETAIYFAEFDCQEHHYGMEQASCCMPHKEKNSDSITSCKTISSESCCETNMEYIQWDEDLDKQGRSNYKHTNKALILSINYGSFEGKPFSTDSEPLFYNKPPPLKTNERLIRNQQLRLMPPLA